MMAATLELGDECELAMMELKLYRILRAKASTDCHEGIPETSSQVVQTLKSALKHTPQQKLAIAFRSENRRWGEVGASTAEVL